MTNVRANVFFCEDVRLDNEGKPIFISVLSPVVLAEEGPITIEQIVYVNLFYATPETEEFSANLTVEIDENVLGIAEKMGAYKRSFRRPDETGDTEWLSMSQLKFRDVTFQDGGKLRTSLVVGTTTWDASLQLRVVGDSGETKSEDGVGPDNETSTSSLK